MRTKHTRNQHPGGTMTGLVAWVSACFSRYSKANPNASMSEPAFSAYVLSMEGEQ